MKKLLLCLGLLSIACADVQAKRSGVEVLALIGGGSTAAAGLGLLANKVVHAYPNQSTTLKVGTGMIATGAVLVGVESYLQYNSVASSFDTPAKIIAAALVLAGFAAAEYNR